MPATSGNFSRRLRWIPILSLVVFWSEIVFSSDKKVRYLNFAEVAETLRLFADSALPGSNIADADAWNHWIRERDVEVRARIERELEDSVRNLVLYGTSYTNLPRLESAESAVTESGEISAAAQARAHALAIALGAATPNERLRLVRELLARKGIAAGEVERFLSVNLKRFLGEQEGYQKKLEEAGRSGDVGEVMLTRGTLYAERGLSVDTSLLPNYALEDTLRSLSTKGVVATGKIRRIAVIGPGLDFTDKLDGYDFYPLQTLQPFAVMEAVARLGLGKAEGIAVVTADLNAAVNSHVAMLARGARAGEAYTVELPRDPRAEWSPEAISYWKNFGEILGSPRKPLPVPASLGGVAVRAVAIRGQFAARIQVYDANIVAETLDFPPGQGFDLVVATNVLVYYNRLEQSLAMANIARLLNPGGIFLANNPLPSEHASDLRYLGRRTTAFTPSGVYGDDVVVYRRR